MGWKSTRKAQVWAVKIVGGRVLRGSYHHPVMTTRGPVWLSLLKKGDRLVEGVNRQDRTINKVPVDYRRSIFVDKKQRLLDNPSNMSEELAQMMGFIAGDGSIVNDGVKLCFWVNDTDLITFYCALFEKLHGVERPKPDYGNDSTVQFKYCYVDLRDYYKHLMVKHDCVPPLIMRSGPLALLSFLAGYYDADGGLSNRGAE